MSQHWVSPSPFLSSSSSHTTQLHYTNSYTYSHPNLNFLQYTIQILVPHVRWSAQAVRELKMDHTQRHLFVLRGTRSTQVQWVGIGTYTASYCAQCFTFYVMQNVHCYENVPLSFSEIRECIKYVSMALKAQCMAPYHINADILCST